MAFGVHALEGGGVSFPEADELAGRGRQAFGGGGDVPIGGSQLIERFGKELWVVVVDGIDRELVTIEA